MKVFFTSLLFCAVFSCQGQTPEFVGKYDYPEVGVNLTIPSGAFGRLSSSVNQQAGMASNGFEVFVGYQIKFKKVPIGWYLSLSYGQMRNGRLDQPTGVTTKNGQYIFVNFLNGLTFQSNNGKFDLYARALISPAFIGSSKSITRMSNGREVSKSVSPLVGLGRGGEMGFLVMNKIRLGVSWLTYGYVSAVGDVSARRPISFWRVGLSYTWKKY